MPNGSIARPLCTIALLVLGCRASQQRSGAAPHATTSDEPAKTGTANAGATMQAGAVMPSAAQPDAGSAAVGGSSSAGAPAAAMPDNMVTPAPQPVMPVAPAPEPAPSPSPDAMASGDDPPFVPFPNATDYAAAGPFETITEANTGPERAFTFVRPRELGRAGVLHPVLTWGNGTGANPNSYAALLVHLASHGFLVIASNSPNVGDGVEMRKGVDWVLSENENAQSPLFGKVHPTRIGATGHSQGGSASCAATAHDRVSVGASIQGARFCLMYPPAASKTMLFFAGGADNIVPASQVKSGYDICSGPTVYAECAGVDHFNPVPDGGVFRGPLTAWFRFHLMGEAAAGELFFGDACKLCMDRAWQIERKNL